MKIIGNEEVFKQLVARETNRTAKPGNGAFNALLHKVARSDSDVDRQIRPLEAPGSINGVSFNPLLDVNSASVPDRVESFLNLLDTYRDMLADPDVSLKEIGPVMEKITSEKNQLQQVLGTLSEGDELRGILNEALVAASLEEMKYSKGDYNPV
jgi:hypothetical protein